MAGYVITYAAETNAIRGKTLFKEPKWLETVSPRAEVALHADVSLNLEHTQMSVPRAKLPNPFRTTLPKHCPQTQNLKNCLKLNTLASKMSLA